MTPCLPHSTSTGIRSFFCRSAVVLEVDGRRRAVVLAGGVDGARVAKAADVLGLRRLGEMPAARPGRARCARGCSRARGPRSASPGAAASGSGRTSGNRRWRRPCRCSRTFSSVGEMSSTVSVFTRLPMVAREAVRDARAAVVADEVERFVAKRLHDLGHVLRHRALGIIASDRAGPSAWTNRRSRAGPRTPRCSRARDRARPCATWRAFPDSRAAAAAAGRRPGSPG